MSDTITITGNIATEPELKRLPSGMTITTFRLASSQRRLDRATGAWVEGATNWYTVSTYRGLADHAYQSLKKGNRVILRGRLRVREWDNDGKKGMAVEVDADSIGHDLLWGVSTFTRDAGGSSEAAAGGRAGVIGADSGEEWSTPPDADARVERDGGWAVPGGEPTPDQQLVGAGADAPF